jgi:hypothetical protein
MTTTPLHVPSGAVATGVPVRSPLATLLNRHHYQLMSVMNRLYLMEAFTKELRRVARGREFRIANDVTWLMMVDTRDVMVIHLASWAKGMYQRGGLIGQLQANHLRSFPRKRPPDAGVENRHGWTERRDREHAAAFGRLFPDATGPYPNGAAFDDLKAAVASRLGPAVEDRHENRAHPYEGKQTGSVKMLDFPELRALVDYGDQLLNDLRMAGEGSPLSHSEMNSPKAKDVAPDIVDSLILGPSDRIAQVRRGEDRDAYYDQLHAEHDRLPAEPDRYFNDRLFTRMLPNESRTG